MSPVTSSIGWSSFTKPKPLGCTVMRPGARSINSGTPKCRPRVSISAPRSTSVFRARRTPGASAFGSFSTRISSLTVDGWVTRSRIRCKSSSGVMASSTFPTLDPSGQSTGSVTDEDLVARAQAGMQEAWTELVHRHHGAVFRAAHAALVSRADADDAAQDAWIAAWKALGEFRGQAAFRTWLLTIAWRKALDRRRGMASWLRILRLDRSDDDDGPPLQLASEDAN